MISKSSDDGMFFDNFFRTINKTVIRFGLCDIRKNNGLELMVSAEADNTHLDLDNSWYHKNLTQLLLNIHGFFRMGYPFSL